MRVTSGARQDLLALLDAEAAVDPGAARKLLKRLRKALEAAAEEPGAGQVVPEIGDAALREVDEPPYRLLYALGGRHPCLLAIHRPAAPPDRAARPVGPADEPAARRRQPGRRSRARPR
jgi:plasmid stabilization system protein ParE